MAVIFLVPEGEREASATDSLPEGADSTLAVQLAEELPDDEGQVAIVLWTAESELDDEQVAAITEQATGLLPEGAQPRARRWSSRTTGPRPSRSCR